MRTALIVLLMSLATSVCSADFGLLQHPDALPFFSTGWEWCPFGMDTDILRDYPYSPAEHCMIVVDGYNVHVTHYDAVYNCCIDDISMDVGIDGDVIRVVEREVFTQPCYCYCYFETYADLYNVPAGDYCLEVWSCWMSGEESLRCSEMISLPSEQEFSEAPPLRRP